MKPIRIDFVGSVIPSWTGSALLTVAVLITALLVVDFMRVQRVSGDMAIAVSRLERRVGASARLQSEAQADAQAASALMQLAKSRLDKLSLPWDRFFQMIDAMRHEDIALLSVEPDLESGIVRVGAEARDVPSMLAYVGLLREVGVLEDAVVLNHQVQQQVQFKPVRFSFVGTWKGRQ